jgi:hypothetical protein
MLREREREREMINMKGNSVRRLMRMMILIWLVNVVVQAEDSPPSLSPLALLTFYLPPPSQDISVRYNWNFCKEICGRKSRKAAKLITRRQFHTLKSFDLQCRAQCLAKVVLGKNW